MLRRTQSIKIYICSTYERIVSNRTHALHVALRRVRHVCLPAMVHINKIEHYEINKKKSKHIHLHPHPFPIIAQAKKRVYAKPQATRMRFIAAALSCGPGNNRRDVPNDLRAVRLRDGNRGEGVATNSPNIISRVRCVFFRVCVLGSTAPFAIVTEHL